MQKPNRRYSKKLINKILDGVRVFPTGWAAIRFDSPEERMFYVPYSEHNDYERLCQFMDMLKAKKYYDIHSPVNI